MSTYQQFLQKKHDVRPIRDFRELVFQSARQHGGLPAFKLREGDITYRQFQADYRFLCTALLHRGYESGRIAVVGSNSYGWILSYLAAATIGVAVPIDKELSFEDMENFAKAADCTALIGDEPFIKGVYLPETVTRFTMTEVSGVPDYGYEESLPALVEEGRRLYEGGRTDFDRMEIDPEALHILIFTSGTTGNAKGVCLSQKNVCANIVAIAEMVRVDPSRHALSILPLHHTYESTIGHLLLLSAGGCISYCDGLRYVGKNIAEYQPSVVIAVPLLLEFMLRTIDKSIRKGLPARYTQDADMPLCTLLQSLPGPLRFLVKRKVRTSLGGRLDLLIVGAAAIKAEVIDAFDLLGIRTYQGYGLTECAPLLAGNNDFFRNSESVGLPIHGVEIQIEEPNEEGVGEIIAKGDNIMSGYYNDPEGTAETMRGGWFHTGDLGKFDEEGFLYITGRCKNVIVTRNGKNIYPEELETRLMDEELIEEALVMGVFNPKKDDISVKAKVFPCLELMRERHGGVEPDHETIRKTVKEVVERINDKLPNYKRITVVEVVGEAFEKTTTKKIKRFGSNMQ